MKSGVILAKDKAGAEYLVNGGEGVPLATTEVGALKNVVMKAAADGMVVKVGKKDVAMVGALLLSNVGLIKKRKFPVMAQAPKAMAKG